MAILSCACSSLLPATQLAAARISTGRSTSSDLYAAQVASISTAVNAYHSEVLSFRRTIGRFPLCKTRSTGQRAQGIADGSLPSSAKRQSMPNEENQKDGERGTSEADEKKLVDVGEGDDPDAAGALSLCLDAIGTMDIDEMDECLAMADGLTEKKSPSS